MLVGRDSECDELDALTAEVRTGDSRSLVIRGEAGIGKSALCRHAVGRAESGGVRILEIAGVTSETDLSFAGLFGLLRPLLDLLPAVPDTQRDALEGALGLTAPPAGDPFTIYAATLSLLAAATEDTPVLVAVDDLQWLDRSSAAALLFVARRLGSEGLGLLFALRDEPDTKPPDVSGVDEMRLAGLSPEASARLIDRTSSGVVSREVVERLHTATTGNPLALVEATRLLTASQLDGSQPLDEPLPVGERLQRSFLEEVARLPEETRGSLIVAAASGTGAMGPITQAIERLGWTREVLRPAESVDLVRIAGGEVRFRHPLVGSAVYHAATGWERRAAHRALAEALDDQPDHQVAHLAASAATPNEDLAARLEAMGERARARGGLLEAADAFERAGRLSPQLEQRHRRLLLTARTLLPTADISRIPGLLDEVDPHVDDGSARADLRQLRAASLIWTGQLTRGRDLLVAAAEDIETRAPRRAGSLLAMAVIPVAMSGDVAAGRRLAERAQRLCAVAAGDERDEAATLTDAALASLFTLEGRDDRAREHLERAEEYLKAGPVPGPQAQRVTFFVSQTLTFLEEFERARSILRAVIAAARSASAPRLLPLPLTVLAQVDQRTGRWPDAHARASEAVELCEDIGDRMQICHSLAVLARVEAGLGRTPECREHATRALDDARRLGIGSLSAFAGAALGMLELGLGNADAAVTRLETVVDFNEEVGLRNPSVVRARPDLIEAYARAGHDDAASRQLDRLAELADASAGRWARAVTARCRGLLGGDQDFEAHFEDALDLHRTEPDVFSRARTQLAFGERLRRVKRKNDAQEHLRRALKTFQRLGANPWTERVRDELRASGDRSALSAHVPEVEELTAQELQVATTVGEGLTNREAAAALFLSPKTVENHLTRIYRKLGVRSRTELAARLRTAATG